MTEGATDQSPLVNRNKGETRGSSAALTTLGRRREERKLDLFLAEFVREFDDRVPSRWVDGLAVLVEVVEEVNLASGVDCDLVARTDAQARIVVRAEIHDALSCSGIGLLIDRARNRQFRLSIGGELGAVLQLVRVIVDCWGFCARRHIGAGSGRDAVLDVRAGN